MEKEQIGEVLARLFGGCNYEFRIDRPEQKPIKITIFTDEPGIVIGEKGKCIKELKSEISERFGEAEINVKEVAKESIQAIGTEPTGKGGNEGRKQQSSHLKKVFIFHKDKYFSEALRTGLGYNQDECQIFQEPENLIDSLQDRPTHILFCEDRVDQLSLLFARVFVKSRNCPEFPIVGLLTFTAKAHLLKILEPALPEIGEIIKESIIQHCQLPTRLSDIKNTLTQDTREGAFQKKAKEIGNMIASRLAETDDRTLRHSMGNLRAASRILNGAFRSGDYNLFVSKVKQEAKERYQNLIYNSDETEKGKKVQGAMGIIESAIDELRGKTIPKKAWHEEANIEKVLVIDDQKAMWEPVWQFILGVDKVEVVKDGDEGLKKMRTGQYDLVLLDVNLENQQENGIEILQRIKHEQFDLPLIMMTAYDDSELSKICLRYGAYSYFVKELNDDRDSVEYYKFIKGLIKSVPTFNSDERKIWRTFLKIEQAINRIDHKYQTEIGSFFKKAYYLFTMDDEHFIPAKLLIPEWLGHGTEAHEGISIEAGKSFRFNGVAYNVLLTSDQVFIAKSLQDGVFQDYPQATNSIIELKTQNGEFPDLIERGRRARYNINPGSPLTRLPEVRHPVRTLKSRPIDKKLASKCLIQLLVLMRKLNDEKCSTEKQDFSPITIDITGLVGKERTIRNSHEGISRSGANHFSIGLKVKYNDSPHTGYRSDTPIRILFIDDEGDKSAWHKPLDRFFRLKGCNVTTVLEYDENKTNTNDYDLILLDLFFGEDHEKGLKYLRKIRNRNLSISIVVLTADNSAYYTRRCLLNGADDYFTKEPHNNEQDYFESFEKMIDFYLNQRKTTKRKDWGLLIEQLKEHDWGLDEEALTNIRKFKALSRETQLDDLLEQEKRLLSFHLREAYFYYLRNISQQMFVDQFSTERLLSEEYGYTGDIFLSLGKFIEYIIYTLSIVQGAKKRDKTWFLINNLSYPHRIKEVFKKIWTARINAKKGNNIEDDISTTFDRLKHVLSEFHFSSTSVDRFDIGTVVQGRIVKTAKTKTGNPLAFVEVENPFAEGVVFGVDESITVQDQYKFRVKMLNTEKKNLVLEWHIQEGDQFEGKVVRIGENRNGFYGVFLEIRPGIWGLLHKNQMRYISGNRQQTPLESLLSVGDKLLVKVEQVSYDEKKERERFSLKPVINATQRA